MQFALLFDAIKCSQWTKKQAAEILTRPLLALLHNTQVVVETIFAGHTWFDWKLMCMVYKAISCIRVNWPKIAVLIFVSFFTTPWKGFAEVFQFIGREMSNWNVYSHDYASTCWRDPSHKQQIICNYYIELKQRYFRTEDAVSTLK